MKNIKHIIKSMFLLSLLSLMVVSCDDDEYVAPGSFTDLSITWSQINGIEGEVDRFTSFMDLSAGAEYSEWRIPKNAFFLGGPIPNNLDKHDAYIINPGDTVSNDKTVHVLWKKGDTLTPVTYYGIFPDSTSFRFPAYWSDELSSFVEDTIKTENIGGKWIADYTFFVDVYDTVVAVPEVRYMDGTILDHKNVDAVTLTFGDQLIFEDLSGLLPDNNGRPNSSKWRMHTTETDSTLQTNVYNNTITRVELKDRVIDTITFDDIGDYQVELKTTRDRTDRIKQNVEIYDIPTIFTVVPLNEPLTYIGTAIESDADVINLSLSHRIRPFSENVAGNFTIKVDGVEKTIESVTRNSNGTKLMLTLDNPLIPQDANKTVIISYDGGNAAILSFDNRLLEAFDDVAISVYVPQPTVQQGDIIELEDQTIQIPFDSNLNPASLTDPTVGFEVLVNGVSFNIGTVSINASDASILDFTMTEQIYRTDDITISYDGSGTIANVGTGIISAFTAKSVAMFEGNMVIDSSFEGTFGDTWVEGASGSGALVEFSSEQAYSGSQSVKMQDSKPRLETNNAVLNYEAGVTYMMTYRRYIASGSDISENVSGDKVWYDYSKAVTPRWQALGAPAPATGTWELVEVTFTPASDSMGKNLRLQPVPTSGVNFTVYYDDFKIFKNDARP